MMETKTDKVVHSCGASSSKCPDLTQVPYIALEILADRFTLGEGKHGRDNWRKAVGDRKYILERLNHVIRHAYFLAEQLQGRHCADDEDGIEGNIGAILWGGATIAEMVQPLLGEEIGTGNVDDLDVVQVVLGEPLAESNQNFPIDVAGMQEVPYSESAQTPAQDEAIRSRLSKLFPNLF